MCYLRIFRCFANSQNKNFLVIPSNSEPSPLEKQFFTAVPELEMYRNEIKMNYYYKKVMNLKISPRKKSSLQPEFEPMTLCCKVPAQLHFCPFPSYYKTKQIISKFLSALYEATFQLQFHVSLCDR